MIWYTEKQLETAWKTYFKVCNNNMDFMDDLLNKSDSLYHNGY